MRDLGRKVLTTKKWNRNERNVYTIFRMTSKSFVISKWQTVEPIGLKQCNVSIIWIQEEEKKKACTNPLELSHRLSWVLSQNLRQKSGGEDLGLAKGAWAGRSMDPTQYCGENSEGPSSLHPLDDLDVMQIYKENTPRRTGESGRKSALWTSWTWVVSAVRSVAVTQSRHQKTSRRSCGFRMNTGWAPSCVRCEGMEEPLQMLSVTQESNGRAGDATQQ